MGKTARRQWDGIWKKEGALIYLKETGMNTLGDYINRWQTTVVEWVALRPIYEVFEKEMGYNGEGRRGDLWWRQTVPRAQLRATIEIIFTAARARRQESRSRSKIRDWEEEGSTSVSKG